MSSAPTHSCMVDQRSETVIQSQKTFILICIVPSSHLPSLSTCHSLSFASPPLRISLTLSPFRLLLQHRPRYRLITYESSLAGGQPVHRPLAPSLSSSRLRFPPSLLALVGGSWTVCFPFHLTSVLFEDSWIFIVQHNGLRNQQATAGAQRACPAGPD